MVDELLNAALRNRFLALWKRSLPLEVKMDANPVCDDLIRLYTESGRFYHDWHHLEHCLREFDLTAHQMESPDAVEMALWFHDSIYVPGDPDNEQSSADLFTKWGENWFPSAFIDKICQLILITKHLNPPCDRDESYIVDIDLSSFGETWSVFLNDTKNVRRELAHIPDNIYYSNHAKFLRMLLNRPRIFQTDFFFERYEEPARHNIKRVLASPQYCVAV
jgi:predicted metal-dependent HD superfamily phosphohydrolase